MSPEYAMYNRFSREFDVFSVGILLRGQKNHRFGMGENVEDFVSSVLCLPDLEKISIKDCI